MIFLFRAAGIFASRVGKYADFFDKNQIPHRIIGWDRLGEGLERQNYDFFKFKAPFATGGFQAIRAKCKWMLFIYKYLKKNSNIVTTVHACDLPCALPVVFFKILHKKNLVIIFDVCDWMSASMSSGIIWRLIRCAEKFTVKYCNCIIICEPERINQIQFKVKIPVYVMRNIPTFDDVSFLKESTIPKFNNDKITVAYVGCFEHGRFIDELLEYSKRGTINLNIAGFGKHSIEEKCKQLDSEYDNVRYYGKVDYKLGLQILDASDLIYAMYCKCVPNHFYAAPNKFYESIFLGKAILSTKGIPLEKKIIKYGTGYCIEETREELSSFLEKITCDELKMKGFNAKIQWPVFSNMTSEFLHKDYLPIIK